MRTSLDLDMNDPEPYAYKIVDRLSYLAWLAFAFAVGCVYFAYLAVVS